MVHRLLWVATLAIVGCAPAAHEPEAEVAPSAAPGLVRLAPEAEKALATAVVAAERLAVSQDVLGQLRALPEAESQVHAPLEGVVTAVHARLGQRVAAGAPLVTLRCPGLGEAQARYLQALGESRLAEQEHARVKALFAAELASKKERDEAAVAAAAAAMRLDQAAEGLRVLGHADADLATLARRGRVQLEQVVRAVKGGTVTALDVAVGERVGPDHEAPLFKLADMRVVRVEADLPERDFLAVKPGQKAEVVLPALGDRAVAARVAALSPTLAAESRTGSALIDVPNPDGALRPGMSCRVRIETGVREVVAVPVAAVQVEADQAFAYVPTGDGSYRETPVKLGAKLADRYEVTSGLAAGQRVVTTGSFDLRSQARKAVFGGD